MTFYILGVADKRPLVYPLLRLLSMMGDTLLATDDGAYRRLLPHYSRNGEVGNVRVFADAEINGETMRRGGIKPEKYEHVVYDIMDNSDKTNGAVIYAKQDTSPLRLLYATGGEPPQEYKTVHIGFVAPSDKAALFIPITEPLMRECNAAEVSGVLSPPKNAKVISVLTRLLAPYFGVTERQMRKLLRYKGE